MAPTPLEISESLEQLRVLENGYKIKVLETPYKIVGVDTAEDLERVRKIVKEDKIIL
jgi:3-deoxy-manno-octulosonate cytidylyltransferase (CMP-KDO synthetase)